MKDSVKKAAKALFRLMGNKELSFLVIGLQTNDQRFLISSYEGTIPRDEFHLMGEICRKADIFGYGYLMSHPGCQVGEVAHRRSHLMADLAEKVGEDQYMDLVKWIDTTNRSIVIETLAEIGIKISRNRRRHGAIKSMLLQIGRYLKSSMKQSA